MNCKGSHDWHLVGETPTYAALACRRCAATCRSPLPPAQWADELTPPVELLDEAPPAEPQPAVVPTDGDLRSWLGGTEAA
jgi:hypothetical protein